MKLDRIPYEPSAALDFFDEALTTLGGLCERTWHDRLEVVAEGRAAELWNPDGALHASELHFAPSDTSSARDAAREVFPGSPLTFRLADALRPSPLPIERLVLTSATSLRQPDSAVAEKLWRGQFPGTTRWRLAEPFRADFHFSLLILARCEIQAIDQHWSLRRLALSLPSGELDGNLAEEILFVQPDPSPPGDVPWPRPDPARWSDLLRSALERDLRQELDVVRSRQETSLRRELERIDDYFENYANELAARAKRSSGDQAKIRGAERLAAAKAEHQRRRFDQVNRHEIRVCPHIDGLLLVAEPAWGARLDVERDHQPHITKAVFVARARRWEIGAH
jgi:hypothetical protein